MVKYAYDAWGNHKVLDTDGTENTDENFIGNLNPLRYRSYYYDRETHLYYLNTRYYDSEVGRFISQDDVSYLDPEHINGLNLFAYCGNNPVSYIDSDGLSPKWWQWLLFGIGAALVVAAAVVLIAVSGGTALPGVVGAIAIGAAKGALIGAAIGTAFGVAGGAIYSTVTGADMGDSILQGFLMGFGIGAIAGAVVGGVYGAATFTPSGLERSAINQAVKNTLKDPNKMAHIMQGKHGLPNSIKAIGKLMKKTLINGTIMPYKSVSSAIWLAANSQVVFTIIDGAIRISDMWIIGG